MRYSVFSITLPGVVASFATLYASCVYSDDIPAPVSPEPLPAWGGSAELGTNTATGNTDTSSRNGVFSINRKGMAWDFIGRLDALYSEDEGVASKEKYYGSLQFNRKFSEHSYVAITVDQDRDRFSGYTYQTTASVGYGYRLVHTDLQHLDIEAAPGHRRDKLQDSQKVDEEDIIRLALKYSWKINEGTTFTQTANADLGEGNTIYKTETGLQSQLNGSLATKLTYQIKYVDDAPDDNKNTDTEFGVTLVYSF